MNAGELTYKAGSGFKADPAGSTKALLFVFLAVLILVVLWKFLKGFGKATQLLSEFGPSTEAEKLEVISTPVYQEGVKWLDDRTGYVALGQAGYKGKTITSDYLAKKKITNGTLLNAAEQVWDAKWPGYISETEVYNAIASLPSKTAISLMASVFNITYKDKLGFYPLNVFLGKYLKLKEMETLTALINKKPEL